MNLKKCPNCGGKLIDDAWEDITENEDGTFILDGYLALVCDNKCGYVKRIEEENIVEAEEQNQPRLEFDDFDIPNLFQFATSELSQDAFICWLLSWSEERYRIVDDLLHEAGVEFLSVIFQGHGKILPKVNSIKVMRQFKNIDILAIINDAYALIIEDKINTNPHSNQLARYRKEVAEAFPELIQLPVYYKMHDQGSYKKVIEKGYLPFKRVTMLSILKRCITNKVTNDILIDYYRHIMKLENSVNAFRTKTIKKWKANHWKGFYLEIQKRITGNWGKVSNPRGGFWGFWSSSNIDGCYLQLEQEKLCIKMNLTEYENKMKHAKKMLKKVKHLSEKHNLKLEKPSRLRAGSTMTIAQRTDYLQVNKKGIIDLDKTIVELEKYI